jgi:trk system potassium uptake protein TrkH
MDFRPILYIIGMLLLVMSLSLVVPMLADLYLGNADWRVFFVCIIITSFFGGSLLLSNSGREFDINARQAFMLVFLCWLALATFAALPFKFSTLDMSFTDAFFEAMSGITTTGSTVITGLETAPPGILLWRAILQWLGGIGIIIMALSVLPFLQVGGMQIFRTELSEDEKALPRTAQLASSIGLIYMVLTLACMVMYMANGLGTFDAVAHALTTISTGGFSTYDNSLAHFDRPSIEMTAILFMIIGGMPFVLYLKAIRGNLTPLLRDSQVRLFLAIITLSIIVTVSYLTLQQNITFGEALRRASFNIISLITGTGYVNGDYGLWGGFVVSLFFFLMVIGGCAGSTSCGIKIFRFQVFYAIISVQIKKLIHPNGVFIAHYNGKPIPSDVPLSVMGFFFLYAFCFALLAVALSYVGLDFLTAMSGAASAISNVGPGLGDIIGPSGTYQPLPDSAKWLLSIVMILGRLEIVTVLVLFHPNFWKR